MEVEKPPETIVLPPPQPIDTDPVRWKVLTEETLPEDDTWVYYGLTTRQYEVLARNMAEILRWVKEAKWRLEYYEGRRNLDDRSSEPPPAE